jgi:hypothetical protein
MSKVVTYKGPSDPAGEPSTRLSVKHGGERFVLRRNVPTPDIPDELASQLEADEAYEVEVGGSSSATKPELQAQAAELEGTDYAIEGYKGLNKDDLAEALAKAQAAKAEAEEGSS